VRAFRAQVLILLTLCLIGVVTWMIDYQQDLGGDWFTRFGITRLVWLGIGLYALVSSILVLLVWTVCRWKSRSYTALGVVSTHGVGVGLLLLGLSLGVHDRLQDAFREDRRLEPGEMMPLEEPPQTPRRAIPAPSPSITSKPLPPAPAGSPAELHVEENQAR
jgi:hypothetical protein